MIYEFKVTLKDIPVPVWRVIQMDSEATFYAFHCVLQAAFNWYDIHLHNFMVEQKNGKRVERTFIKPKDEEDYDSPIAMGTLDEEEERLSSWFKLVNDKVTYVYDFGDEWRHEIVLTNILERSEDVFYPSVIAAKNAAPEEDSRFEVLTGQVDLEADEKDLLLEINEKIMNGFSDMVSQLDEVNHLWENLLLSAKQFHALKPWNAMADDDIFAVIDPDTQEILFCSVLGAGRETFGLAVYIGQEGLEALMDTIEQKPDILFKQRSILLSYEDRGDLQKDEYELIKTYDVPFRGRKAWPVFKSYQPGLYPWMIDNEEARYLTVALQAAIEVYDDFMHDVDMPFLFEEEKVYTKVPRDINNQHMDTAIADIEGMLASRKYEAKLEISEIDLKRVKSLPVIPRTIEFALQYVELPIQNEPDERPFFPLMVIAVEHESGYIIHQDLFSGVLNANVFQMELLNLFQTLGGVPQQLLMKREIAAHIKPLTDSLNLHVKTVDYPSKVNKVINSLYHHMD